MEGTATAILEIGLVLLMAAAAGGLARRVHLPAVVGYLLVGLLVSPFTPGFVADRHQLELFANIGVALLLFEVGVEIDPLKLGREKRPYLWVVPIHTVLVTGVVTGIAIALGLAWEGALLVGVAVALSSSVISVNITRSRSRTTSTETNNAILGWTVIQDITGVLIATIAIAAVGVDGESPVRATAGIIGFTILAIGAAWVLPRVLRLFRDQRDLFLLVSVATGLALAAVGDRYFGVPLALSAFIAGLAVSEGPMTRAARETLLPFRDVFAVLFFVSVGTLIDPASVPAAGLWITAIVASVILVKGGTIVLAAKAIALPGVAPAQQGVALGQIGEFSFVLATLGIQQGAITPEVFTGILAAMVITIAASSIAVRLMRPAHMKDSARP